MKIDEINKRIIAFLQGDIPLEPRPFAGVAAELGLSEQEVVDRVAALSQDKTMRRFGATLRHQKSGFSSNVMVAWLVPEEDVPEVGAKLASFRAVSHCYWRRPCDSFSFNLFTMVHGRSRQECEELVAEMAKTVNLDEYDLLFSVEELKKTSMRYFDSQGGIHGQ